MCRLLVRSQLARHGFSSKFIDLILRQLCRRIGRRIELRFFPPRWLIGGAGNSAASLVIQEDTESEQYNYNRNYNGSGNLAAA